MPHPAFDQSTYQVRFEWGMDGLARLAPADIVIVVDVLSFSTRVIDEIEVGVTVSLDAATDEDSTAGASIARRASAEGAIVMLATHRNAEAVAHEVMRIQTKRGARTSVAVVAVGERGPRGEADPIRFAVEDFLGAGAVMAALADLGIDHCSPEAAAAGEASRALRGATRHLLSASGTGRALAAAGYAEQVSAAVASGTSTVVPVLRDAAFMH